MILPFISDEHLFYSIDCLFKSYEKAKKSFDIKTFYKNKIDIFKWTFDNSFGGLSEEEMLLLELNRQIDKTISNAIGEFHENILGGIKGFQRGKQSGYDIKADDNTLFAELKNKYNTMNSSATESVYQKLSSFAKNNPNAKCYLVQILSKSSFSSEWSGKINGKNYNQERVYIISGDRFYELLTGDSKGLFKLYECLPTAITKYLGNNTLVASENLELLKNIKARLDTSGRKLMTQMAFDNFNYYKGFDSL
jgi:hypothetical protein